MKAKGKFILCSIDEFDGWLANAAVSRSIRLIQNHHTWSPAYSQFSGDNHFPMLQGMESFHIKERGFDMIAQNLTTFPDGTVVVCRPLDRIPAGIKGANQGGICIEHLGNFDAGKDTMTDAHRSVIIRVNALLCRKFGLVPSTDSIVYHHWYDLDTGKRTDGSGNTKTCPGSAFFGGNSVNEAAENFIPLVSQPFTPTETPVNTEPTKYAEVTADLLNVRCGGNISNPIVKQLLHGIILQVYEEKDGWSRIAPDRQEWVNSSYLQSR